MKNYLQFIQLVRRCSDLRQVTRLWNWADHQPDCEGYFALLLAVAPWAFRDPADANSIRFTY